MHMEKKSLNSGSLNPKVSRIRGYSPKSQKATKRMTFCSIELLPTTKTCLPAAAKGGFHMLGHKSAVLGYFLSKQHYILKI